MKVIADSLIAEELRNSLNSVDIVAELQLKGNELESKRRAENLQLMFEHAEVIAKIAVANTFKDQNKYSKS